MTRYILANFNCEMEYADPTGSSSHNVLPAIVKTKLSAMGKHLKYLAGPDSKPTIVTAVEDLATCDLDKQDSLLPWGQTNSVAGYLGAETIVETEASDVRWEKGFSEDFMRGLWQRRQRCTAAKATNNKHWAREFRDVKGWAPLGFCKVDSLESLQERISGFGAEEKWVVKAPFGAAGRQRVRRTGSLLSSDILTRLQRLFSDHGSMILEPWQTRVVDFGVTGLIEPGLTTFLPIHRQLVDESGVCRGIETHWQAGKELRLQKAMEDVADALRRAGYLGPFGIDGYAYRDASGRKRILPLSEVNARLTFGHVAYAKSWSAGNSSLVFDLLTG